ncbi:hypothetical protein FB645_000880 [Coemansia sp. IMI 203386]|nr:hypothetical protein FB645_000880 [Coemansia sp. IMI 203386]
MQGDSKESTGHPAYRADSPALDLKQAMEMDPLVDEMALASQQHRRRAVQYIPARERAAQEARNSSNTPADADSTEATESEPMPLAGYYTRANHALSQPPVPRIPPEIYQQYQQQRMQIQRQSLPHSCSGSVKSTSNSTSPQAVPPNNVVLESTNDHNEEQYLRRVSVLYHELWSSDWIDRQLFGSGPLSLDIGTFSDTGAGTSANTSATASAEPVSNACQSADQKTAVLTLYSETIASAAKGTTNATSTTNYATSKATIVSADKEKARLATLPSDNQTIAENISKQSDNGPFSSSPSIVSTSKHIPKQTCYPETQHSWASFDDDMCADQDSPMLEPARDRAQTSRFSPSDLADALIGTVHRLEDDKQLVQRKRWSVIKELATTEAHYLRDLLLIRAIFYEPLAGPTGNGLLRSEDAATIFGNLDEVIECARSLVEYLTVAVVYEANRCCALGDGDTFGGISGYDCSDKPERHSAMPAQWSQSSVSAISCGAAHALTGLGTQTGEAGLRNSAWAEISIAQAFLLTSQRMERAYSEYCRNFEAASQRLIEIKHMASTMSASVSTPATIPTTPQTMYHQMSSASSPFVDGSKSARLPTSSISNFASSGSGARTSGSNAANGSVFSGQGSLGIQLDRWDPEDMYSAMVYQFMLEQAHLLSGKTTSWDLPSLLIKPVQRILKYPLLIRSMLSLTRAHTADHSRLEKAALGIECIAESINTVNRNSGLRISTVSGTSSGAMTTDENQSRITRELRRVLRRRPANIGHLRSKSNMDSSAQLKPRISIRPKSRARDASEANVAANSGSGVGSPASGVEALVEQHEVRISELIRSLRRWENDIGSMLCQQAALVGRWRDFYILPEKDSKNVGTSSALGTSAANLSMDNSGSTQSTRGGSADTDEMIYREYGKYQQLQQIQQLQQQIRQLETRRHLNRHLEPRTSRSHNALRTHAGFAASDGVFSRSGQHGRINPTHMAEKGPEDAQLQDDRGTSAAKSCEQTWQILKNERVAQYHSALEKVYKTLYPRLICHPFHSSIYPVLNSLLQVYSDGPRRILGEIARLSGSNDTSPHSAAEGNEQRIASLHSALANDLPKLFEHERSIVHLLCEQIVSIKHEFYTQTTSTLLAARGDIDFERRSDTEDIAIGLPSKISGLADLSTRAFSPGLLGPLNHSLGIGRSDRTKAWFDQRQTEPVIIGPSQTMPSPAEMAGMIQSGIWLLAHDGSAQHSSHYVLKSRHRQSAAESTFSLDSFSDSSMVLYDYPSDPMFESVASDLPSAHRISSNFGGGSDPTLLLSVRRDTLAFPSVSNPAWQPMTPVTAPDAHSSPKATPTKHRRKKSIGFIDRIANLRSGRASRNQSDNTSVADQRSNDEYENADQVKSRAQLGMSIAMSENDAKLFARSSHRAMSDAGMRGRDAKTEWSNDISTYEPLPLVDPIRFSKGFIDDTFHFLGTNQDKVADASEPAHGSSIGTKVKT